jgi:hypothetical protein
MSTIVGPLPYLDGVPAEGDAQFYRIFPDEPTGWQNPIISGINSREDQPLNPRLRAAAFIAAIVVPWSGIIYTVNEIIT